MEGLFGTMYILYEKNGGNQNKALENWMEIWSNVIEYQVPNKNRPNPKTIRKYFTQYVYVLTKTMEVAEIIKHLEYISASS